MTNTSKSEWVVLQNLPFAEAGEILINENGKWRKPIQDGYCMDDYTNFLDKITNIKSFGNMPYFSEFIIPLFNKNFSVPCVVNEVLESLECGDFHHDLDNILESKIKRETFIYEIFRSLLKKAGINEKVENK